MRNKEGEAKKGEKEIDFSAARKTP